MTRTRMTIEPQGAVPSGRPWGVWTSIAWLVAAMAPQQLLGLWIVQAPSQPSIGPVLDFLLWAIAPVVLVIAVLIRRLSIARCFAWTVPRPHDVLIAVGAAFVLILGIGLLAYVLSGGLEIGAEVDAYRQYLAAGGTPPGFLLRRYQAVIFAPLVEETAYRGFLWRGLAASRIGNWGAWLLTSAFFVANHIRDYAQPQALILVAVMGLILGLVRWRTGSTTASMITHSLFNVWDDAFTMLAAAAGWA